MSNQPTLNGVQLRDYFAAHALQGLLSHPNCDYTPISTAAKEQIVDDAYVIADAMMAAREPLVSKDDPQQPGRGAVFPNDLDAGVDMSAVNGLI